MNKLIIPVSAGISAILCAGVVTAFARTQDDSPASSLPPVILQSDATGTPLPGQGTGRIDDNPGRSSGDTNQGATPTPADPNNPSPANAVGNGTATPTSATNRADGTFTYAVDNAGTVTIRRAGRVLTIENVSPAPGWSYRIDDEDDRDEVEISFSNGPDRLKFKAEVDDGQLHVQVEDRSSSRGDDDHDDDDDD